MLQIGRVLVENALVHTPAGTVVRVSTAVDGGRATLTVADDGPGIPAEAHERIFERFYRLDGGRASGSGLGLAIARELAEVMGGRIELESAGRLDAVHARAQRRRARARACCGHRLKPAVWGRRNNVKSRNRCR